MENILSILLFLAIPVAATVIAFIAINAYNRKGE